MDTEENEPISPILIETEIYKTISRILDATWNEVCEGSNFVKETVHAILDDNLDPKNYKELISEVINDVIRQYFNGDLVRRLNTDSSPPTSELCSTRPAKKIKNSTSEESMDVDKVTSSSAGSSCPKPNMSLLSSRRVASLNYLITSFNRCTIEHNKYSNFSNVSNMPSIKKANFEVMAPEVLKVIKNCSHQILKYSISILTNKMFNFDAVSSHGFERSPLLQLMYERCVDYENYLRHLIDKTHSTAREDFTKIFMNVLDNLYFDMKNAQIKSINSFPIETIDMLIELMDQQLFNSTDQPICKLVVEHPSYMPEICSDIAGREISRTSYLSPFLAISILSEENPFFPIDDYYQEPDATDSWRPKIQLEIQSVSILLIDNLEEQN